MTEIEYLSLCEKYLKGICTPQEEILLKEYQDKYVLSNPQWIPETMGDEAKIKKQLFEMLQASIQSEVEVKTNVAKFKWRYTLAAAVILVFISFAIYFANPNTPSYKQNIVVKRTKIVKNEILPGSNKAVLTLADGSKIILDNAKRGVLTKQGNTSITKSKDGMLVYNFRNNGANAEVPNALNTIAIPRGGKYEIVLPDGTKVWLNSSSTLTFPTLFTGSERAVQLSGEAYFEVAKNKDIPFKIRLNNNNEVKVLGTHFNIMAYDDDPEIKTTLLEGSVKLTNNSSNVMLVPGQQGVTGRKNHVAFRVGNVNTEETIAWKNGKFMFVNEDLKSIMKKISRWYDVDVNYADNLTDRNFTGTISEFRDVSEVLRLLELTGAIHFKIEERRIYVMQ